MLTSRKVSNDEFIKDFFATMRPGAIPRSNFISWVEIDAIRDHFSTEIDELNAQIKINDTPNDTVIQFLASVDDKLKGLQLLFRLVGHTPNVYVSSHDRVDIASTAVALRAASSTVASEVTSLLVDLGISRVFESNIDDVLLGVSIGLETHRRKNIGGDVFKKMVGEYLNETVEALRAEHPSLSVESELTIKYLNGRQEKRVDFAIMQGGMPVIGIEVNFYTSSGSKPSEIKRSYARVRQDLEEVGVELAWVTDGEGYNKMQKSLSDAQETHPNVYNFSMLQRYFSQDILDYLKERE